MSVLKKIFSLILAVSFLFIGSVAFAADDGGRPRVAVLYTNEAKTTYDGAIDDCMMKNMQKVLSEKFEYVKGDEYLKKLSDVGMTDLSFAERRDIIETLEDDKLDYIICMSVQPLIRKEKFTVFTQGIEITATVPFKIINVNTDRYLYNGKFTERQSDSTMVGSVGNKSVTIKALKKINKQINSIISEKMSAKKQ